MIKYLLFVFLFFCTPITGKADFIFAMDMDLTVGGIQSSRSVSAGANFDAALILLLDGGSEVSGFSLGASFDPTVMQIQSVDVSGRPTDFENVNPVTVDNVNGIVRPFDGFSTSNLSAAETVLATFNISAASPLSNLMGSFSPEFQQVGFDGVSEGAFPFDNAPLGVTPGDGGVFFQAGTLNVSAVPEPSTLLMVSLAGGAGLGFWRRQQGRKRVEPS